MFPPVDPLQKAQDALQASQEQFAMPSDAQASEMPQTAPEPFISPVGQAAVPPNLTPFMAPAQFVPVPQIPPMPASPLQDPKAKLMAIAALGMALGAGPNSGIGRGAVTGVLGSLAAKHAEDLKRWQFQAQETKQQQLAAQSQNAMADRQRNEKAAQLYTAARADLTTAKTRSEYRQKATTWAGLATLQGVRTAPEAIMEAIPFAPPKELDLWNAAVDAADKKHGALFSQNPAGRAASSVTITTADGEKVSKTIGEIEALTGTTLATTDKDGNPIAYTPRTAAQSAQELQQRAEAIYAKGHGWQRPDMTDLSTAKEVNAILSDITPGQSAARATDASSAAGYVAQWAKEHGTTPEAMTTAQIDEAQRQRRDSTTRPAMEAGGDNVAMSQDSVDYLATSVRMNGINAIPTRFNENDKKRIVNKAAEQAKQLGQTPAVALQKAAAFKADAGALTRMRTMGSAAQAFETKAVAQADLIQSISAKVPRTQWPILNEALLAGKARIAGDEQTQLLYNALSTFTAEYAKIMEGSTGSAQGSSDAARRAAERLAPAGLNPRTLASTLAQMKYEMRLTLMGYDATIASITERMTAPYQQPAQSTAPAAPATPEPAAHPPLQKFGGTYIWDGSKYVRQ